MAPNPQLASDMLAAFNARQVAVRTLVTLREVIESRYETIPAFHEYAVSVGVGFDAKALYKCLPGEERNAPKKKMSLEFFVRICGLLNIGGARMREMKISNRNITLEDFLEIDAHCILQTVAMLPHQDYIK